MLNQLQQFLDTRGLPWRESRAELIARYGLRQCHWSLAEVVELDVAPPPFPGLIRPLQFRHEPFRAQHVPPAYLSGYADPRGEAIDNLHTVADTVAGALGPGAPEDHSVNARGFEWRIGPARLLLLCFPPRLQDRRTENHWHQREPRLRNACHIGIDTGYRPPLSERERGWVDGFASAITLHDGRLPALAPAPIPRKPSWLARLLGATARPPPPEQPAWSNPIQTHVGNAKVDETALETVREPPPSVEGVFGRLGASAGGEVLIWCFEQLRIVPRAHLRGIRLDRYEPERGIGSGDALLVLTCAAAEGERPVEVPLARRYGIDSLDDLAREAAEWLGLPLEIAEVG